MEMFEFTQKQLIKRLLCDPPGAAPGAIDEHRRSWPHHRADMGIGSRRSTPLLLCSGCSQLLWLNGGVSILCGQTATGSNFQAAQWLAANGTDRSRQTGAALEPATGSTACSATERGHANRATLQVARKLVAYLLAVDKNGALSGAHSASATKSKAEKEKTASNSGVSRLRERNGRFGAAGAFSGMPIYRPMVTSAGQHKGESSKENPPGDTSVR